MRTIRILAAALLLTALLAACGGGGGDEVPAGQCYVAGNAATASACQPTVTVQPVVCGASGVCS